MKNKKNIEHFFQENFKDFEVQAPTDSWNNISKRLNKEKKKRVLPLWIKFSSIAAAFLLGLFLLQNDSQLHTPNTISNDGIVFNPSDSEKKNDSDENFSEFDNASITGLGDDSTSQNPNSNNTIDNTSIRTIISNNNSDENLIKSSLKNSHNSQYVNTSSHKKSSIKKDNITDFVKDNISQDEQNQTEIAAAEDKTIIKEKSEDSFRLNKKSDSESIINPLNIENNGSLVNTEELKEESAEIIEYLAKLNNSSEEDDDDNNKKLKLASRWSLTPNIAPITMNSFSGGSPISDQLNDNSKEYLASTSVGLGINYALTEKISIRTGVNKFVTGYNTHDVAIYATANAIDLLNNNMNINYTGISNPIVVRPENSFMTESATLLSPQNGYLNHKLGYIEIPMEVSYKLLDSKFNIDIIGGFSTLFLQENEVSVIGNGMKTNLGEATNMNDVHFSTNLGIGFRYEIFKSFDISIEPMFKYQIGTYSKNSEGFKPYILGVYTGLSFKF